MANLHAMFGLPRSLNTEKAACTITLMDLQDAVITVTAEAGQLPGTDEKATQFTLSAKAGDQELTSVGYDERTLDYANWLFSLCVAPSDAFVAGKLQPFVQRICEALGRPMAQVIKLA